MRFIVLLKEFLIISPDTRDGLSIDYDKLTFEIETDGSVVAEDCLAYAARILQDQLGMFINFDEPRSR